MLSMLWTKRNIRRTFILVLILATLVFALGLFIFYLIQDAQSRSEIRYEAARMLLQLNIVVLIGGILVERYGNYRDMAKAENAFRKDLLAGMMRAYNDTRKVRRILNANVVRNRSASDQVEIPCAVYERQLERLNDPQLQFELFKRQLQDVPALYKT